jgi:hypothetical protein
MEPAVFFPSHQSKLGEMTAIGHLSPLAKTRTRPTFNITKPASDNAEPMEYHLSDLATRFAKVWGTRLPIYFDFPRYGPEVRVADGRHPAEYFFECVKQCRIVGIPVAGPESVRGPGFDYLDAVARIAFRDGRGAGVRIPYRNFSKADSVSLVIEETLRAISLKPESVDVVLDFEALFLLPPREQTEEHLYSVATEAFRAIKDQGFRNVVISGSNIPDQVGKEYNWNPLRVPRTLLKVWRAMAEQEANPPRFGDSGVIYTHDKDSAKSGPPPSRIRLSTDAEYVLCRAPRGSYRKLCSEVLQGKDLRSATSAWGVAEIEGCGKGRGSEGNATSWVARDTNLHDERTVALIERVLRQFNRLNGVSFADPESYPWLQVDLDISEPNP